MRRALLPLLSVAVLFGPVVQARAADEARDVILKAIKAHGGAAALKKYQALQTKSKGKMQIDGIGEVEFTQDMSYMAPDKFKEAMELDIAGKQISVVTRFDGKKLSIEADGKEIPLTDGIKKAIKNAQQMLKSTRLERLLEDKAVKLETLGETKVQDKPAVGVRVVAKGRPDVNLYFDKKTGLLAKTEYRTINAMTGEECTEERIILEYAKKNEQGLTLAKKALVKRDDKKYIETEITEAKVLEKIDDSEFSKDS